MNANRQPFGASKICKRITVGVFFGVAILVASQTSVSAQSYVPGPGSIPLVPSVTNVVNLAPTTTAPAVAPAVAADPASAVVNQTNSTTSPTTAATTTTLPKTAQVKGVTIKSTDPAFTGANTFPVVALGVFALTVGTVLTLASRRRRTLGPATTLRS